MAKSLNLKAPLRTAPALLIMYCIVHIPALGTLALSVDDEYAALRGDPTVWISQGRWTAYLIERFFITQPAVAFLPVALLGVGIVLGFYMIMDMFDKELQKVELLIIFPLFAIFPTWIFCLEFTSNLPAIALGIPVSIVSACCALKLPSIRRGTSRLTKKDVVIYLAASSALAVAIAAYQSFILFTCAAFFAAVLVRILDEAVEIRELWRYWVSLICVLAGGIVIYIVIWYVLLYITKSHISYIGNFLNFSALFHSPIPVAIRGVREAFVIYGGYAGVYGHWAWAIPVLVFGAFITVHINLSGRPVFSKISAFGAFLLVLFSPFAINLLAGGFVPYRTLVAVPCAMLLCAVLFMKYTNKYKTIRTTILLLVSVQSVYSVSLMHTSNQMVFDRDRALAGQLYGRIIEANQDFDRGKTYIIGIIGSYKMNNVYPQVSSSVIGKSFFEWDGGNVHRILAFMKLLGYENLTAIPDNTSPLYAREFLQMPVWPAKGSVKVLNDVTLVRMGDRPGIVHSALAEELRNLPFLASQENTIFRLRDSAQVGAISVANAQLEQDGNVLVVHGKRDAQIILRLPSEAMARCKSLQVTVDEGAESAETVTVYFLRKSDKEFGPAADSASQPSGNRKTSLFFRSESGFEDLLRFDPGDKPQRYRINELEVGCLERINPVEPL